MTPGLRTMPILTAYRAPGMRGHWYAAFPDGPRTYPSQAAMRAAAFRAGAAIRFTALRPATDNAGLGDPPSVADRSAARSLPLPAGASAPDAARRGGSRAG